MCCFWSKRNSKEMKRFVRWQWWYLFSYNYRHVLTHRENIYMIPNLYFQEFLCLLIVLKYLSQCLISFLSVMSETSLYWFNIKSFTTIVIYNMYNSIEIIILHNFYTVVRSTLFDNVYPWTLLTCWMFTKLTRFH